MGCLIWICAFLLFHRANSYVLLTANVDDLQAIVNQVAGSPVFRHVKDIWNGAKQAFRMHYDAESRRHAEANNKGKPWHSEGDEREKEGNYREQTLKSQRSKAVDQIVELGRNASLYLSSLKDIFDRL